MCRKRRSGMRGRTAFVGWLILLLLPALTASAADGRIAYLIGEVTVRSAGETTAAEIGMPVSTGDVVETGSAATAIIELGRGAEIKLRENSRTRIGTLDDGVDVELERGGLFALVRRAIQGGFSVNTETVVAGVRGTQFFVAFGRTVENRPDVWLCVNEGEVSVEVPDSGDATVVREGEGINILDGVRLTDAQFYDWTRELNWNMDPADGEVFDDTNLDEAYADLLDQDYD
jgi:ferric-dicitrate binding protein FerR (iron transport regulator)